jgi:sugar lactone lactonase YvrE
MSYKDNISLKLINNTSTDQPIGLLGGTSSIYANSDNNVLVQWDLATEDFTANTVTLETTTPITVDLQTQSVKGVVDALNTTNKATFTFSGTLIYATSLLDDSVQSANIIVGDGISIPVVLGNQTNVGIFNSFTPAQIKNLWINSTTRSGGTVYISASDSVEVGTQFYNDDELQNQSFIKDYYVQGLSNTEPFNILEFKDGVIQDIISSADLPTDFSPSVNNFANFTKTNIFSGNNNLSKSLKYNISTNGKYLFGMSTSDAIIYRYSFNTAWDFSTLNTTTDQEFNILSTVPLAGTQAGFTFNPTGEKFYFRDADNGGYRAISLSTAWDLTTGSVDAFSSNVTNDFNRISWNANGDFLVGLLTTIYISNYSTTFGTFNLAEFQTEQIESNIFTYINPNNLTSANLNQFIVSSDGSKWYVLFSGLYGGTRSYQIVEVNITDYSDITTISQITETTQVSDGNLTVANGLWWNEDNTKLYVIVDNSGGDIFIDEISLVAWNINGYTISQTDSSFSSPNIQDWFISDDGSWLFLADIDLNRLVKYELTTPFDMSTINGTPNQTNSSIVTNFTFADSGNYLYTQSGSTITRYPTTAPYDIGTLTSDQSASITSKTMEFSRDGLKLYSAGGTVISEFSLSTPFDITTFSFTDAIDVSAIGITLGFQELLRNISFSPDGTKVMIFVSNTLTVPSFTAKVFQCTCSTPFDVSTATYDNVFVDTTANGTFRNYGGIFNPNGSEFITLYLNGNIGSSSINKFETFSS